MTEYRPWMGNLTVDRLSGNYGTRKYFLDETISPRKSIEVQVEIAAGGFAPEDFQVEVFTNLNRRDHVKPFEPLAESGNASSYWMNLPMVFSGRKGDNFVFQTAIQLQKCGAYRLTTRFRLSGSREFWWHNDFRPTPDADMKQRDCAVVVSPAKAASLRIYEANALSVEALHGGDFQNRSTLEDFLPGNDYDDFNPFDLEYIVRTLGFNTLWLMPIFPNTRWRWNMEENRWAENDRPGSPYAARDYFSVNPWLSRSCSARESMGLFRKLVEQAENIGLDVFLDVAFNHAGRDVVFGEGGVKAGLCRPGESSAWIRDVRPSFCTRGSEQGFCGVVPHYRERATDSFSCALYAPADRLDEHVWDDANVDWFFGDYSALGPKPWKFHDPRGSAEDERDLFYTDLSRDRETLEIWRFFAHIIPFWLEKTGNKLAGIRADFAQGLPNRLWEFIVNTTRNKRWDFVFLAEVLDPDKVQYRLNRVFDVVGTVDHGLYRSEGVTMGELVSSLERESGVFGDSALFMHNGTSHDEEGGSDRWGMVGRYAVAAAMFGVPMVFMGQPLGVSGKLPFRDKFADMYEVWTSPDAERGAVAKLYRRINRARQSSPELTGPNRRFLPLMTGGFHHRIFSVARWVSEGTLDSVVLVFVNLNTRGCENGVFRFPGELCLSGFYKALNLVSDHPGANFWSAPRSAKEIYRDGVCVQFTFPNEIQFLRLQKV